MQSTDREKKLVDITNTVMEEMTRLCTECDITSDNIKNSSLACFLQSPKYVTYRARLEGTSETDSGRLISLIEEWVSSGRNITVAGVLMTVDTECSVVISSLVEEECSQTHTSTMYTNTPSTDMYVSVTKNTTAESTSYGVIIGAVVGGVLTVSFITVAITVVALVKNYRRKTT